MKADILRAVANPAEADDDEEKKEETNNIAPIAPLPTR